MCFFLVNLPSKRWDLLDHSMPGRIQYRSPAISNPCQGLWLHTLSLSNIYLHPSSSLLIYFGFSLAFSFYQPFPRNLQHLQLLLQRLSCSGLPQLPLHHLLPRFQADCFLPLRSKDLKLQKKPSRFGRYQEESWNASGLSVWRGSCNEDHKILWELNSGRGWKCECRRSHHLV